MGMYYVPNQLLVTFHKYANPVAITQSSRGDAQTRIVNVDEILAAHAVKSMVALRTVDSTYLVE